MLNIERATIDQYPMFCLFSEEILQSDNAMWFSPDSEHLLFASFDDTDVSTYFMSMYEEMDNKYVLNRPLAYPKVVYGFLSVVLLLLLFTGIKVTLCFTEQ